MSEVRLSWSGADVTVTDEYLDVTRVSVNMEQSRAFRAVSYTHLTLPTSDLV